MRLPISILTVFLTLAFSCGEPCIDERIAQFKANQSGCVGASISTYEFQGKTVYAMAQGSCVSDAGISIINDNCENVCTLLGIASLTECEGVDFFENAELIDVLFEVN